MARVAYGSTIGNHPEGDPTIPINTHSSPPIALANEQTAFIDAPPLPEPESWLKFTSPSMSAKLTPRNPFSVNSKQHGDTSAIFHLVTGFVQNNWSVFALLSASAFVLLLLGMFAFKDMSSQAWMSLVILSVTLTLLITGLVPIVIAMLLGLVAMLAFGIVSPERAITGFSNTGVMTIAVLFVVAEGVQQTSLLLPIFRTILGNPKHLSEALLRLLLPVAAISAFLNNTPVVAMLIPVVETWARRSGFPVSKLLMPMNNAAILGGTLTLIGTSTNLVVDGLARDSGLLQNSSGESVGLPIFGITPAGTICLVVGMAYMLFAAHFLLPDRQRADIIDEENIPRKYSVAFSVLSSSAFVGSSVHETGLKHIEGLDLVQVTRAIGKVISSPNPDTHILAGDTLLFAGAVDLVTVLYHMSGLVPATKESANMIVERHDRRLVEVVITSSSRLVGRTSEESQFRSRFSVAVIGVCRYGEPVRKRIENVELRPSDTLLVEGDAEFTRRFGKDGNFALVSEVSDSQPPREDSLHMIIAAVITLVMIFVATVGWCSLMTSASVAAFLMVATGCLSFSNAARSINLSVIVTIAASFGISNGMQSSGSAQQLANAMMGLFAPFGTVGLCAGVYIATACLAAVITHIAAVALMFPVIQSILDHHANQSDNLTVQILYCLMIAGSASFSTPIGYQTNMMVHAPGGYTFMDWVVFGLPMQLLECIAAIAAITLIYR